MAPERQSRTRIAIWVHPSSGATMDLPSGDRIWSVSRRDIHRRINEWCDAQGVE